MFKFKKPTKTGVMMFGSGGTLRIGYGTIPPDEPPAKVSRATIQEVEAYLKKGGK